MSESNPIALRALYLDTAAQIDAMAARFDDVENGVTIADQLRAFAATCGPQPKPCGIRLRAPGRS